MFPQDPRSRTSSRSQSTQPTLLHL